MVQFGLHAGSGVWLDGLVVECILLNLSADDLARVCLACKALSEPAQAAAKSLLLELMCRIECTPMQRCDRGTSIAQLRAWGETIRKNLVWLQADADAAVLVVQDGEPRVKSAADLSGNGHRANAPSPLRMPLLLPEAINGHAAFAFAGESVLKTVAFAEPLPQPITLMVVARARGDTTIVDSLGPASSRFELCHGYPQGWHPAPEICMTASGRDAAPKFSMRGSTRGTGEWHIFTAVFDGRRSEVFVDGYCECSGKPIGANALDGLSVGCDHNDVFFLQGAIAELRLFHCRLPFTHRVQTEASLARRYGLTYSVSRELTSAARTTLARFSCASCYSPVRSADN